MTMKLNYISTYSLNSGLRTMTLQKQVDLNNAQIELTTGFHADIGKELGAFTSAAISLESHVLLIDQTKVTNSLNANRISTMQAGINNVIESGNDFVGLLAAEMGASLDPDVLVALGETAMETVHATLNTTFRGEYVYSGLNSDSKALYDYNGTDGAAAKAAVQAAFVTEFGFNPSDAAAQSITPAALDTFIDGVFDDLFNDANWEALWTGSSDRGVRSKIATDEFVENSTTAYTQAFRSVTSATVMIAEFASANFHANTVDRLAERAVTRMSESIEQLGDEQAKMGIIEARISDANDQMDFQKNLLTNQLLDLTAVDPYEAATKLNQVTTSLEASYAATARIQALSLLNFI